MEEEDSTVNEIPVNAIPPQKEIRQSRQEYISKLRDQGSAINKVIVIAVAKGLALAMDHTRLLDYGSQLQPSEDLVEMKQSFLTEIIDTFVLLI